MSEPLDGNAIAGDLFAAFGREMTTVIARCRNCGATAALAELRVYVRAPGAIGRCSTCDAVMMVLVGIDDECHVHMPALELQA